MTTNQAEFDRAREVLVGGVNSAVRAFRAVGGTPRFIARAEGAWRAGAHVVLAGDAGWRALQVAPRAGWRFWRRTDAAALLATLAEPVEHIATARDFVVSSVGERLYEMFFRGYTLKQWGLDPSALDRSVTARVPTRLSEDDRYFQDRHQCMPRLGYTRMFENMLDHPNITVMTGTDFRDVPRGRCRHTVFTGPVDAWFDHRFGPLPYRSLVFEHETRPVEFAQPVATINHPGLHTPYTRTTEFKHITGQAHRQTSLCRERSSAEGEPYYPVPNPANQALFKRYEALADAESDVTFLGRLGTYRYMNMDQVVGQALAAARRILVKQGAGQGATLAAE
jgi:UDP-galactopyranose mutase